MTGASQGEKGDTGSTRINAFPPIMVLHVLTWINPTALLRGNVLHELVHCSKERVVLSGKSVIAVGARCCTDVRANELIVVRGCCVSHVQ